MYINFIYNQLLIKSFHLGYSIQLSNIMCCSWFFLGTRLNLFFINLFYTLFFIRKSILFLNVSTLKLKNVVLFVNIFKAHTEILELCAKKCFQPYALEKWFPGSLTNIKVLLFLLEFIKIDVRMFEKYAYFLRGFFFLRRLPSCLISTNHYINFLAIKEATLMNIPIISTIDSFDTFVDNIPLPIPTNTKSIYSVYFYNNITSKVILLSQFKRLLHFKRKKFLCLLNSKYYTKIDMDCILRDNNFLSTFFKKRPNTKFYKRFNRFFSKKYNNQLNYNHLLSLEKFIYLNRKIYLLELNNTLFLKQTLFIRYHINNINYHNKFKKKKHSSDRLITFYTKLIYFFKRALFANQYLRHFIWMHSGLTSLFRAYNYDALLRHKSILLYIDYEPALTKLLKAILFYEKNLKKLLKKKYRLNKVFLKKKKEAYTKSFKNTQLLNLYKVVYKPKSTVILYKFNMFHLYINILRVGFYKNFNYICDFEYTALPDELNQKIFRKIQQRVLIRKKIDLYKELLVDYKATISVFMLYNKNIFKRKGKVCIIRRTELNNFLKNYLNFNDLNIFLDTILYNKYDPKLKNNFLITTQQDALAIPKLQVQDSLDFMSLYFHTLKHSYALKKENRLNWRWINPDNFFSFLNFFNKIQSIGYSTRIKFFEFFLAITCVRQDLLLNFWLSLDRGTLSFETLFDDAFKFNEIFRYYSAYEFDSNANSPKFNTNLAYYRFRFNTFSKYNLKDYKFRQFYNLLK